MYLLLVNCYEFVSSNSTNQPDYLLCHLAIISILDLRRGERKMGKGEGGEHRMSACQCIGLGVSVESRDPEISESGFTECAPNELINIH